MESLEPIGWDVTNNAWQTAVKKADITDFRLQACVAQGIMDRQAGTSGDELNDLRGWQTRSMVDP